MSKKTKEVLKNLFEMVLVVVITYVVFSYVVKPVRIEGSSMRNTLRDQDMAIMDVIGMKQNGVDRFDIVVVDCKSIDEAIIKRVIGLPNETIEYKNDQLFVNGQMVEETFFDKNFVEESKKMYNVNTFTNDFKVTLGEGEYFVLGDNRLNSKDSRVLGAFGLEDFIGKNGFVIYPFESFGWMNNG